MTHSLKDGYSFISVCACGAVLVLNIWRLHAALAHFAPKGWEYPWECCHDHDCAEIADSRVHTSPSGYVVDEHFVIPQSEVRQSPDGKYHACFPRPDKLRCFFAPPAGS